MLEHQITIGIIGDSFAVYQDDCGYFKPMTNVEFERYLLSQLSIEERARASPAKISAERKKRYLSCNNKLDTRQDREKQARLLNVKNGVVDLSGAVIEVKNHSPDYRFVNYLNFEYISDAKIDDAPFFKMFVERSLLNDPERLKLLLEILGACISNFLRFKKAYFLIGKTNSGKTLVADLIVMVIGEENVATVPFDELCGKFACAPLVGKQLNYDDELSVKKISSTGNFKKLTSMSLMKAEAKGQNSVNFVNRAHLLTCGNDLPNFGDFDGSNEALFKRMVVLDFPVSIPDSEIDIELANKLWAERDIIFSLAVNELHRLVRMNPPMFTKCEAFEEMKKVYVEGAAALDTFIRDCCDIAPDKRIYVSDFLAAFKTYCKENALDYRGTDAQIKKRVLAEKGVEKKKLRLPNRKPLAGFTGIGLSKVYEEYFVQD